MVFEKRPEEVGGFQTEIVRRTNDNTRRIRMLEQSLDVLNSRVSGIEEQVISDMDALRKNLDQLSLDIRELGKTLNELRGEILKINKNLDKTARKTEIKELESLLELYSPIRSKFVTKDELEKILEEKTSRR